jgi:dihydrofolate reductase
VVTHEIPAEWVVTHPDAPFSFVTDGVEAAIARAQEIAGDRVVSVAGGTIARQCLDLGLLDEVAIDLVPVVMGAGNRPFFGDIASEDVMLDNPTVCIQRTGSLTWSFRYSGDDGVGERDRPECGRVHSVQAQVARFGELAEQSLAGAQE